MHCKRAVLFDTVSAVLDFTVWHFPKGHKQMFGFILIFLETFST